PQGAGGRLVDHGLRIGQAEPLAIGAGGQQEDPHGGGQADADGGHVALHILHAVADGHARGDRAGGAGDVKLAVLVRELGRQVEQLGRHQGGGGVVDFLGQHDDPVVEQPGEDIVGPLAAVGLFDNIGYQAHVTYSFFWWDTKVYPPCRAAIP